MGFLDVNARKRRALYARKGKLASTSLPSTKKRRVAKSQVINNDSPEDSSPNLSPIERLPAEILEMLFVLSGNFNLPQTSLVLAQKLSRSRSLESSLIAEELSSNNNRLPVRVTMWSFVTSNLLSNVEFEGFVGVGKGGVVDHHPYIPLSIETGINTNPVYESLAAFMLERGCRVEDSIKSYKILGEKGYWTAVSEMAKNRQRADLEIVVLALKSQQPIKTIIDLIDSTYGLFDNWGPTWIAQKAAHEASLPEVKEYLETIRAREVQA